MDSDSLKSYGALCVYCNKLYEHHFEVLRGLYIRTCQNCGMHFIYAVCPTQADIERLKRLKGEL